MMTQVTSLPVQSGLPHVWQSARQARCQSICGSVGSRFEWGFTTGSISLRLSRSPRARRLARGNEAVSDFVFRVKPSTIV
eukprot:scaffold57522_cov39-Phaeocystis_antarctica.AAC.1